MGFEEVNRISESIDSKNIENENSFQLDSGEVVSPEPTKQVENDVLNESSESKEPMAEDLSPTQKRINKLTAQKKSAQEENTILKQEIDRLKEQMDKLEVKEKSKDPEITVEMLTTELKKAVEEGDIDYQIALNKEMSKLLLQEEKNKYLAEQSKLNQQANAQTQEWNILVKEYGKYGLNDQGSDLFQLSKAYFENDTRLTTTQAVAKAFKDMLEDGTLSTDRIARTEQQLAKERSKMALGGGNLNHGNMKQTTRTETESNADYIKERIAKAQKMRGFAGGL